MIGFLLSFASKKVDFYFIDKMAGEESENNQNEFITSQFYFLTNLSILAEDSVSRTRCAFGFFVVFCKGSRMGEEKLDYKIGSEGQEAATLIISR